MKRVLIAFAIAISVPLFALAYVSPGKPTGFVNDFAGMLKPETVADLNAKLDAYEASTGNEITVVTIPSLGDDETIETYATKLFDEWKIGKAKEDNGLLFLVSRDDRELRIEPGYGLEPVVTDIEASHIISDIVVPEFQNDDYDAGVTKGVDKIIEAIGGDVSGEPAERSGESVNISGFFYPAIILFIFLGSVLGKSRSWWAGGVIGVLAGIVMAFFFGLAIGAIALAVLTPLGLLFDFIVSRAHENHRNGGPRPPWFLGGMGGGRGGFGGGGFGGFGGGMSGGGGASGRW